MRVILENTSVGIYTKRTERVDIQTVVGGPGTYDIICVICSDHAAKSLAFDSGDENCLFHYCQSCANLIARGLMD